MSAEAVGWVYRHSPYSGQFLAVHLAIADVVNDQANNQFWMALPRLSEKARVNRGTAKRAIDQMVADSFLTLVEKSNGGRSRPSVYRFQFPDVPVVYETRASGTEPAHQTTLPAHHARGIEPKEPNEHFGGRSCFCGAGPYVELSDYMDHIEVCDEEMTPAADLKVVSS